MTIQQKQSQFWGRDEVVLVAKILGLILMFALAPWGWLPSIADRAEKLYTAESYTVLALFLGAAAAGLAAIVIAPFLKSTLLRGALVLVGLIGFALDQMVLKATGNSVSIDLMQTFWQDLGMAGGAVETYASIVASVAPFAILIAIVSMWPPSAHYALNWRYAVVPLLAFALMIELMYVTREDVVTEVPAPISVPAQFIMAATSGVRYRGEREAVKYEGKIEPRFKTIVYIVDESVRGDYLGLNSDRFNNTPFLNSVRLNLANFGVAVSATNCSRGTRYILRTGLRQDQMPDASELGLRQPSMWDYAKRAGFKTVYINAFGGANAANLHSFMNEAEAKAIDKTFAPQASHTWQLDDIVAEELVSELSSSEAQKFIFVEKFGTHAPWSQSVPDDFQYDVTGLDKLPRPLPPDQTKEVAKYLRALRWSVDRFFEKTFVALNRPDTLVIYTADHGQSMYEGGYEATHCTKLNPTKGEAAVPLFVIAGDTAQRSIYQQAVVGSHNRASHFEIYPELISAFGYEPDWVQQRFGPGLRSVQNDRQRRFSSTQPLKSKAIWVDFDK